MVDERLLSHPDAKKVLDDLHDKGPYEVWKWLDTGDVEFRVHAWVRPDRPKGDTMLVKTLHTMGLRDAHLEVASFATIGVCIGLWIRAKTIDQNDRAHAEWRALFVGLWSPTLWLMRNALRRQA